MSESKMRKRKLIIFAVIVAFVVGLMALAVFLLTYKKETHITKVYDRGDISSLVCTTSETKDSAFFQNNANSVKHELKIIYNNEVIDKMSYEYRGEYGSWGAADVDEGIMHAKYNTYMGDHNISSSVLAPLFQNVDGELKISLYLDSYEMMNTTIAPFFYIGNGLVDTIGKSSVEETKKYYENKGFSCIISD